MFRGFTQKKVHSYTLGEQLKNFRSEGRVTLHEVSRETKIPMKYLGMIEEGKYDLLPPDVYVKGFLRSYGEFLGVDPAKLISLYQKEKDIRENMNGKGKKEVPKKKKMPVRFVVTPKIITAAAIFLIAVGGFAYLYSEIGRFAAEPRLVVKEPSGDVNVEGNSVSVVGITDEDAKLAINGQSIMVNDKGEFREDILLQNGINTITISSVNRFNKESTKTLNVKSSYEIPEIASSKTGTEAGNGTEGGGQVIGEQDAKNGKASVVVRIDAFPTWLSVEADGHLVYSGTMLPGAVQDFEGENEVRITSGKANQTFIKVNGKDEKVLDSSPGIVRDVMFGPGD